MTSTDPFAVAIRAIRDKHGKEAAKGHMECPKCKGKLHYQVQGYNGHIYGRCETPGCLSWMM